MKFRYKNQFFVLCLILFIVLLIFSLLYVNDGRAYDGPLIRGFPLPYSIQPTQMICENFDEEILQCLDENNSIFYPLFLIVNSVLCLVLAVLVAYCYTKLYELLKFNLKK